MSVKGTGFVDQVLDALRTIRMDAGFATSAGERVTRGRPGEMQVSTDELPMIVVSTLASGSAAIKPRTNRKDREIQVVGVVMADQRDYEPELDDLDEDITRALSTLTDMDALPEAMEVAITGGDYTHPEGGSNTAATTYTVTISYALTNHEG